MSSVADSADSVKKLRFQEPEKATTMFAKLPSGKMWAALLEKAIAKLLGGYNAPGPGKQCNCAIVERFSCTLKLRSVLFAGRSDIFGRQFSIRRYVI